MFWFFFFFKQKTAYELRISDWSAAVCSTDLFNPTDREGRTARYNPLSDINRADPIEVLVELQKIATMLFVPPEKGEAFWTESARTAFVGIASWIAAKPERPFSFGEIYRTITMPGMKAFFAKEAGDGALSEGCRAALSDFTSSAEIGRAHV